MKVQVDFYEQCRFRSAGASTLFTFYLHKLVIKLRCWLDWADMLADSNILLAPLCTDMLKSRCPKIIALELKHFFYADAIDATVIDGLIKHGKRKVCI